MTAIEHLQESVRPLREQVVGHPVYGKITSPRSLQVFMEHHAFAVWDFMLLLKALQRSLSCVEPLWRPVGDPAARHLINAIVLAEESDEDGRGGYASHFELYREAMVLAGAAVGPIDRLLANLDRSMPLDVALAESGAPVAAQAFVRSTWAFIESGSLPGIAAAFTLGREELIPDLFRSIVSGMTREQGADFRLLDHYLARHIDLDGDEHAPMAFAMLAQICGDDPKKWDQARSAADQAISARMALWDGIAAAIG